MFQEFIVFFLRFFNCISIYLFQLQSKNHQSCQTSSSSSTTAAQIHSFMRWSSSPMPLTILIQNLIRSRLPFSKSWRTTKGHCPRVRPTCSTTTPKWLLSTSLRIVAKFQRSNWWWKLSSWSHRSIFSCRRFANSSLRNTSKKLDKLPVIYVCTLNLPLTIFSFPWFSRISLEFSKIIWTRPNISEHQQYNYSIPFCIVTQPFDKCAAFTSRNTIWPT